MRWYSPRPPQCSSAGAIVFCSVTIVDGAAACAMALVLNAFGGVCVFGFRSRWQRRYFLRDSRHAKPLNLQRMQAVPSR